MHLLCRALLTDARGLLSTFQDVSMEKLLRSGAVDGLLLAATKGMRTCFLLKCLVALFEQDSSCVFGSDDVECCSAEPLANLLVFDGTSVDRKGLITVAGVRAVVNLCSDFFSCIWKVFSGKAGFASGSFCLCQLRRPTMQIRLTVWERGLVIPRGSR